MNLTELATVCASRGVANDLPAAGGVGLRVGTGVGCHLPHTHAPTVHSRRGEHLA